MRTSISVGVGPAVRIVLLSALIVSVQSITFGRRADVSVNCINKVGKPCDQASAGECCGDDVGMYCDNNNEHKLLDCLNCTPNPGVGVGLRCPGYDADDENPDDDDEPWDE